MPAVSKKQQRFFGMVRAAQKGELENPSPEVADVANDISVKDAKKFAKTKHKGIPEKKMQKESFQSWRKKASEAMKRVSKKKEEKKPQMDATTKKLHKWRKDKEHAEREKYVSPFRPIGDD